MKKTLSFFAAMLCVASVFAQWDGTSAPWTQGNGTRTNPYQISTPNQLAYLSDMVSAGYDYAGQYFLLTNNISLSNQSWYPIGDASHIFKGNFDGGGHLVDSINVTNNSFTDRGLFGRIKNDTIKNLNVLANISSSGTDSHSGSIAGYADSSTFNNCTVNNSTIYGSSAGGVVGFTYGRCVFVGCKVLAGNIYATVRTNNYAGGFIGYSNTGTVRLTDCDVSANTIHADYTATGDIHSYAGGLIGLSNSALEITNCNITANSIYSKSTSSGSTTYYYQYSYCGGLVGYTNISSIISGCTVNVGTLYSYSYRTNSGYGYTYSYAGGILGYTCGMTNITECYVKSSNMYSQNYGASSSSYSSRRYTGGMVGYTQGTTTITKCINHAVTKGSYAGGVVGYASINTNNSLTISLCANLDSVFSTTSDYAGGIVGYASRYTTISYCYNVGVVGTSNGGTRSGIGFIYTTPSSIITNCYNSGYIHNGGYGIGNLFTNSYYREGCGATSGGTPRTMANMKSVSFPIILNADSTVFVMDLFNENNGYPVFAYTTIYDITTDSVTNKTSYSARLNGHCGGNADSVGFVYREISSSDSSLVFLPSAESPAYYILDSLQPNTSYSYRFFAMHNGDTVFGNQVTFTTHPFYTLTLVSNNSQWGSVSGGGTFAYSTETPISATAFTNYRFLNWSDGNQTNPRNYIVTQNETITAVFGPAIYNITLASNNNAWGSVSGSGSFNYNASATITATPAPHYHFVSWSDGNNSNPRTLIVTTDLNLTATFAPDQYNITSLPNNATYGSVTGSGTFIYGDIDTLTATPFEHYRFTGWNDRNTNNPRYLTVTSDSSFTAMFVYDAYTLTLSTNNQAWGSVSGGGMYEYGQQATATATANEHYHFVEWSDGNSSNPRTLMITADLSLQAVFAPNNYTVTVQSSNPAWGTTTGSGTFAYGAIDTITATPVGSHVFAHWNDGTYSNPRHFTVQGDTTITAVFAPSSCTLTLTSNNTLWGTVSGGGTFQYGQSAYCTAMAETGYHFVQWSDGNTDNPRIYMVEDNTTLTATFAPNQYTITLLANDTTKGTVSGGGVYDYNQSIYIIALPNDGYTFSQWSDGNTTAYRQITVTQDMIYTAVFSDIVYTVTALSNNSTYGYVTGGGQYTRNSTATLTAVPSQGYHFEQWSDGNMQNPRTITVLGNMTYFAQFAPEQYTITVNSANISQGTVSGNGIFSYGTFDTLIANPMPHHHFVQWNDNVTTNPRVISVTADSNFTAYFAQDEQYTITVISNSPSRGSVTGGGSFYLGDQTIITATPYTGCVFNHWNDGDTHLSRQITVTQNMTYTATFSDVIYTLTVQSNNPNYGYVSGGGQYVYNSTATLTAYANNGYRLAQWNDGDTHTTRTITVTSNMTFYAQFVPYEYNVTVNSSNSNQGTATGSGVFEYGTQATIRAYPMPHHHFVRWNDNITTNPRIISVTSDSVFTAYFAQDEQYAINVVSDDQTRGTVSGGGTYFSGEQITITATAFSGYTFSHWSDGNTESSRIITVLTNTTYTAYFAAPMYTVNVSCNENEGSVSGGGTYEQGTTVTVTATPNQGYRFVRWSNGLESDAYSFEIFGNVNLVAYFESINGIEDVDKTFNIAVTGNNVSIYGAEGSSVVITDVVGRSIYTSNKKYHGETIDVQCSGVYLVKVGENIAKKIVIIK